MHETVHILTLKCRNSENPEFAPLTEHDFIATALKGHDFYNSIELTLLPLGNSKRTCIRYDNISDLMENWEIVKGAEYENNPIHIMHWGIRDFKPKPLPTLKPKK